MKSIRGKLSYRCKVGGSLILTFLLFLLMTCLMIQSVNDYMAVRQRLARITQIQVEREGYFSSLQDAETGQRGFVITGDEQYLEPYNAALEQLPRLGRSLERLVADDPFQREHLQVLERLAQIKLKELDAVIRLRRTSGFRPAAALVETGLGKHTMEKIRRILNEMQQGHRQQLSVQMYHTRQSVDYMFKMIGFSQVLAFVLLLFLYGIIYRETRYRSLAEQKLQEANTNLERKVAQRTNELKQSNQELEQFAFVASHDLQAPLRKIQVFIELFKNELDSQTISQVAQDYLSRIEKSATRMQDLIIDLLAVSRVNRHNIAFKQVDLNKLALEAVDELSEAIQIQQGRVEVETLCQIEAEPEQIRQLLINLISNGIKYHREGIPPIVKVFATIEGSQACRIVVEDNGIGIPTEYREKVFEIFQRLHGSQYQGTGIGLSIVKRIVERHGGSIKIEGRVGQGTQFIIDLPIRQDMALKAEMV